ncbi:MAG: hypothetical protein HC901_01600, partial [Bdellovibrionaceae bacterium]|nr:hypothetical protein [Pseudobdellovibrionaceae bacterium]
MIQRRLDQPSYVYINTGAGWRLEPAIHVPIELAEANEDRGVRVADINGDGLSDIIRSRYRDGETKDKEAFLGTGKGWISSASWRDSFEFRITKSDLPDEDLGARFGDLNGDGLMDVLQGHRDEDNSNQVHHRKAMLNSGSAFSNDADWYSSFESQIFFFTKDQNGNGLDYGYRLMDANGDGLADVLRSYDGTNRCFLNASPPADIITGVENGMGGKVYVFYERSNLFDNSGSQPGRSHLSFPLYCVKYFTAYDGYGPPATTTYAYEGGFFDHVRREFNGFHKVTSVGPWGQKTIQWFHQSGRRADATGGEYLDAGSIAKKGIPYKTEIFCSNGILRRRTLNKVEEVNLQPGISWAFRFISQTIDLDFLPNGAYRATAKSFVYD